MDENKFRPEVENNGDDLNENEGAQEEALIRRLSGSIRKSPIRLTYEHALTDVKNR